MRHPLLGFVAAIALAGCVDYGRLQKGFCDTAAVSLCDDFESSAVSSAWSKLVGGGGSADVVRPSGNPKVGDNPLRALRGRQILKAEAPAGAQAMLEDSTTTANLNVDPVKGVTGDLYVRTYVYIVDASPSGPVELVSVRDPKGMPIVSLQYENALTRLSAAGMRDVTFALTLVGDHWFCFELAVRRDLQPVGATSPALASAELYVDDNPDSPGPPSAQLGDITVPSYGATRVGVDRTGVVDGAATTIAFDEVIINGDRIGCAQ